MVWVNRYAGDYTKRESVRGVIGWVCFALFIGYIALNVFLPNNDLNLFLDAIIWVLGLYVVLKYIHKSTLTIFQGTAESPDFLVVGVTISWLCQSGRSVGSIISRLSGFDPAWVNGEFFGAIKILTIFAAVCHVISAGAIPLGNGESLPKKSRYGLAATFVIAISVAFYLLATKPDLRPWIDTMPNWSKDMFQTGAHRQSGETHS